MLNSSTNLPENYRRRSTSAWLLALAIVGAGCALDADAPSPDDDATVTFREPLWKANGVTLWTVVGGHVPVCFDGTVPADLRTEIRNAITNAWMRVANLDFNGFGNCPANVNGQVKVIINPGLGLNLGRGTPFGFPGANASSLVEFVNTTPSQKTIIHEFGHILGFIHEHVDTVPTSCTQRMSGGVQLTPFDEPNSIMSQSTCNNAQVLSPLDIVGAQVAYGERLTGSAVGLNSQCVDVPFGAPAGTAVRYSHCTSVSNQRWRRDTDRHLFIPSLANSFLDIRGGFIADNAIVQTYSKNVPPTVNQQWSLDNVSVVGVGGTCADVPGGNFADGTQLQIFTCHGLNNQKWTVQPDGSLFGNASVIKNGNFCWDVPGGQTANGTILQILTCNGGNNQKFTFTPSGQMTFPSTFGPKCVDVQNGLPNDGSKLQLFTCKASSDFSRFNQRFHVTGPLKVGDTACMDIPNFDTSDNVTAQVFACNGAANQTWDFYPGL